MKLRSPMPKHFLAASLFSSLAIPRTRADCYAPNGILARDTVQYPKGGPELLSCGEGSNNCCMRGEKCGSNLLGYVPDGHVTRQYCADPGWVNCSTLAPEYHDSGVFLLRCGNNVFTYGKDNTCKTGPLYFVDPSTGQVDSSNLPLNTAPVATWSVESLAILSAASTARLGSSTSTLANAALTTSDSTTIATPGAPETTSTHSSLSSTTLSGGAGAGIGIGCAAAIAAIGLLAWLLVRERRNRRSSQHQAHEQLFCLQVHRIINPSWLQKQSMHLPSQLRPSHLKS
ncbi:hypothetical protein EJ07DRAFT_152751 [Lizonia empirigonia]|nr:hypothetical protein EJ07DRAFT_152751 [Lizonia empirigonia]